MPVKINPYLSFNGLCREAMHFYKECFGGDLTFQTYAEIMGHQGSGKADEHIMHSMLKNDNLILMGTDMTSQEGFIQGNDMSIAMDFDSELSLRTCYAKLSDGGQIIDELGISPWGDLFGVVRDKYGKIWMMNHAIKK